MAIILFVFLLVIIDVALTRGGQVIATPGDLDGPAQVVLYGPGPAVGLSALLLTGSRGSRPV